MFAWLWPMVTLDPFQVALTSFRPTLTGQLPPLPSCPLRPSQAPSMSHCFCAPYMASTQPVSLLLALPVPQLSSEPLNTAPVL